MREHFGVGRLVYNVGLEMISRAWSERKEKLTWIDVSRQITILKQDPNFSWMRDVTAQALGQKLRDLDRAYVNFFKGRARYPRFKSRYQKQSIRFVYDDAPCRLRGWRGYRNRQIVLPKIGILKWRDRGGLPKAKPKLMTISLDASGRYFASFTVEFKPDFQPGTKVLGIDMGLKSLAVLSDGTRIENPKFLKKHLGRLRFHQRRLSKAQKGSNRRTVKRKRVARIHTKIQDSRCDYLQKATTRIIRESQAGVICVEDLNVKGMVKNDRLSRALHDASISEFLRMLEYKAEWAGIEFVKVDQWYASTKTCSACGVKNPAVVLGVEHWICPECGANHDRDLNAATNIAAEGLKVLRGTEELTRVERSALADRACSFSETDLVEA